MSDADKIKTLTEALESIVKQQPCTINGSCFYPMFDGDGNEIGVQDLDPLSVIQEMGETAQNALRITEDRT